MSIRAIWSSPRFLIVVAAGLTCTAALAIGLTIFWLRANAVRDASTDARNLAIVLSEQTNRSIQSIDLMLDEVKERIHRLGADTQADFSRLLQGRDVYELLTERMARLTHATLIALVDKNGQIVSSTNQWPLPPTNISDRPHFKYVKNNNDRGVHISDVITDRIKGIQTVLFLKRINDAKGDFLGAVAIGVRLSYFQDIYESVKSLNDMSFVLIRKDGSVILRYPERQDYAGTKIPAESSWYKVVSQGGGQYQTPGYSDGTPRLISARPLRDYPLVVNVAISEAAALAHWRIQALIIALGALLAALCSALLIGSLNKQFRRLASSEAALIKKSGDLERANTTADAAMSNMSQGLIMIDAAQKLVVCNSRYMTMYNLPVELLRPGCPVLDILKRRVADKTFLGDPEIYIRNLAAAIAAGKKVTQEVATGDGRVILVESRALAGGGWVQTHTDITERKKAQLATAEALDSLVRAETMAGLGHIKYDLATNEYSWSEGVYRIHGKSPGTYKPTPESVLELIHPDDRPILRQYRSDVLAGREPPFVTVRAFKDDGQTAYLEVWSKPIFSADGAVTGVFTTLQDATRRKQARDALAGANHKLLEKQYAMDQAVIVAITDVQGKITYANDKFCRISGYSQEELLGSNHRILNSGAHPEAFFRDMYRKIAAGEVWRGEICNKAKNGSLYWVDTTIVPQLGANGKPAAYMAIRVDITARKTVDERITYMAAHDALTGIGNRVTLHEKMTESLGRWQKHGETFAVLLLDLDGFKHINDTLGHAAGDELLKDLARRLEYSLREDDVLTRLGGDEFAIVQSCASNRQGSKDDRRGGKLNQREAAIDLAVRLLEVVSEPFKLDGHDVTVGTSIGIALVPEDGVDASELMKKADLALYRVKSEGRNNFHFFDEEMSVASEVRLRLVNDLRMALIRGEFELHYQPVFDAKTRRPCGVEALVRWRHPVDGLMSPDRFIPLAEETGLMEPLGEWILERACTDAASWPDSIKVAVNLSAVQFRSGKLFDVILCALVESGLSPERLELEITESVLMQNAEDYGIIIQQLKNIGISIALDDFGTGYSSLSYLTTFPFDKIKIDKSFTQGLENRADCAAIVASVLTLARGLDMIVTAEGVETKQEFELLRAAGVHLVQGYLFGRPTPLADLDFSALEHKGLAIEAA